MIQAICDRCGAVSTVPENRVLVMWIENRRFDLGVLEYGQVRAQDGRLTLSAINNNLEVEGERRQLGNLCPVCVEEVAEFAKTKVVR